MKPYRIAAIPADGIGPEVIDAGLQALEALQKRDGGFALDTEGVRALARAHVDQALRASQ